MKILIIRFSSIGDIVMTSPIVRMLKEQLGAEVHFITKKKYAELVTANRHIDKVWLIQNSVSEIQDALSSINFDVVIDLHRSIRSRKLCASLGKPVRSFKKLTIEKWVFLLTRKDLLKKRHVVDRYLEGIADLGISDDGKGLEYFIQEKDHIILEDVNKPRIAIVMGGTYATKRIPVALVNQLVNDKSMNYFLLGGKDVRELKTSIASHIYDFRGRYNIGQSSSIMDQSDVVVTGDTGLMHISAALRKPTIVLWGSTGEVFGMYPWVPANLKHLYRNIQVENLNCQPCSKYGRKTCPKGHMLCLNGIDFMKVRNEIDNFLKPDFLNSNA